MICHFIPSYLLARVAESSTDTDARSCSRATLQADKRFRRQRESVAAQGEATPQAPAKSRSSSASVPEQRVIYSADNTEELPGRVARRDEDPATGDAAVDEAHASSGQVWDLFSAVFGWESVDGHGSPLTVTVHFSQNYDNAFWDGSQLVFGDGDGQVFERFTKPMDVMAHEFAHGFTQYTAGLVYRGQSGALNESVSDVFASMTKQRQLGQTADQADWLIGEGLFRPGIHATALRSMIEPGTAYDDPQLGKDPQVGSMDNYIDTTDDNGGVHLNSGIPNRAFALAALALGGASWERAGRVWFEAMQSGSIRPQTDFEGFAEATVATARSVFAHEPEVATKIINAWQSVGLLSDVALPAASVPADPTSADPTPAPGPPETLIPGPPEPASVQKVAVQRTGGFAGLARRAELDLGSAARGREVRQLLTSVNFQRLTVSQSRPDRFVYTVEIGDYSVTLPEQDLPPELDQVVRIVLDDGDRENSGPR